MLFSIFKAQFNSLETLFLKFPFCPNCCSYDYLLKYWFSEHFSPSFYQRYMLLHNRVVYWVWLQKMMCISNLSKQIPITLVAYANSISTHSYAITEPQDVAQHADPLPCINSSVYPKELKNRLTRWHAVSFPQSKGEFLSSHGEGKMGCQWC